MSTQNELWHTDKWFTDPSNHDAEVADSFAFTGEVEIHDMTLRDGEQQAAGVPELVGQTGPNIGLGNGNGIDDIVDGPERIRVTVTEQ